VQQRDEEVFGFARVGAVEARSPCSIEFDHMSLVGSGFLGVLDEGLALLDVVASSTRARRADGRSNLGLAFSEGNVGIDFQGREIHFLGFFTSDVSRQIGYQLEARRSNSHVHVENVFERSESIGTLLEDDLDGMVTVTDEDGYAILGWVESGINVDTIGNVSAESKDEVIFFEDFEAVHALLFEPEVLGFLRLFRADKVRFEEDGEFGRDVFTGMETEEVREITSSRDLTDDDFLQNVTVLTDHLAGNCRHGSGGRDGSRASTALGFGSGRGERSLLAFLTLVVLAFRRRSGSGERGSSGSRSGLAFALFVTFFRKRSSSGSGSGSGCWRLVLVIPLILPNTEVHKEYTDQ
jgi:hypothetical protein